MRVSPPVIKSTREKAGHTQEQAAAMVHVSYRTWQDWEGDRARMPFGLWELYLRKIGHMTSEEEAIARWLSPALDDPDTCDEMKADIKAWFARFKS